MILIALPETRVITKPQKNRFACYKNISANHNQSHPKLNDKRQKSVCFLKNRVELPVVDTKHSKPLFEFHFLHFVQFQSTVKHMSFSVSNAGIQWFLYFGPDFAVLTVKNLVQKKKTSSQETALPP